MNHAGRTRRARLGAALGLALALILLIAPAASAHATLLFATPAVDGAVPTAPRALSLVFDQPVGISPSSIRLAGPGNAAEVLAPPTKTNGGAEVTARVPETLPLGVYTVTWQVIAEDGDSVTGTYQFGIGPAAALTGASASSGTATQGQGATTAARWILFTALAVLLGELWGRRLTRHPPRPWSRPAALLGAAAGLVLLALQAGSGSLTAAITHPDLSTLEAEPGILALVEIGAFVLAALAARRPRVIAVSAAAVIVAEALRAHPHNYSPVLGALTTAVHLSAAGLWVGGLLLVVRARRHRPDQPNALRIVTRRYARTALWLLAAVLVSGSVQTLIVLPLHEIFTTGYGQLLLVKLALVALAIVLAAISRVSLTREHDATLARSTRFESLALVTVLALAASITAAAPPRTTDTALPFAPPAQGPVVPLGSRAGQIGIYAEASVGQLTVYLSAPDTSADPNAPGTGAGGTVITSGGSKTTYQLTAALADPAGHTSTLSLRGCGDGCFTGPATWKTGTSQLTLHASASSAHGGTAALPVPYPAHPDQAALTRVVAAMNAVNAFTLHEQTDSDTTEPNLTTTRNYPMTGAALLASDPYGNAKAPAIDVINQPGGTEELLLDYPALKVAVQLEVAANGRITRETLAGPDELITRAFLYPEAG